MLKLLTIGMQLIKRQTETNWPNSRSMMRISQPNSKLKKKRLKLNKRPVRRNLRKPVKN